MKKRWISFLLAVVLVFGMVSMSAVEAFAASSLKASEDCIALIKQLEGFQTVPKQDYSQWSVGYGSACNKDDYPNGITEAQADALLREDIARFERSVNSFIDRNSLKLNQNQFDALISFTYNVGSSWMNDTEGAFRKAVVNGSTGSEFLYAITRWCVAGTGDNKAVQPGLVKRRLAEANLYLNGVYAVGAPANFTYVIYNNNITDCTNNVRIQAYDAGDTVSIKSTPTKRGYRFLGWYTASTGGKLISSLNNSTAGLTLYAHWQQGDGLDKDGKITGVACEYSLYAANTGKQVVLEEPKAGAKEVKTLGASEKIAIVAEYLDASGAKWGKISGSGWVKLSEATEEIQPTEVLKEPVKVIVTANGVNLRGGPDTSYNKVGTANKGQELTITGVQQGKFFKWGKFDGGWICLDYTDFETAVAEKSEDANKVTAIGTVVGTDVLNVRSGPGTGYAKAGTYLRGEQMYITVQKKVGGTVWYKTEKGWVHSFYIKATAVKEGEVPDLTPSTPTTPTEPTEPDNSGNSTGTTPPKDDTGVIDTGTIFNCTTLRIRAKAGTGNAHVGDLASGTKVEIYEYTVVRGSVWGRIDKGWIHMGYVKLDEADSSQSGTVTGTVVKCTKVNIRSGAGTYYGKVGELAAGSKVQILQLMQLESGAIWARTSLGWIHTDYLEMTGNVGGGSTDSGTTGSGSTDSGNTDNSGTTGGTTGTATGGSNGSTDSGTTGGTTTTPSSTVKLTGTIVNTDSLRVRSGPGVNNAHVGDLAKGTRVEILEQTIVNRNSWGRTEQGWICLYYVQLDAATSVEGATVKTVVTDTLRIRSGAGTDKEHIGNYYRGNAVVILEETTVNSMKWGRTELGWISLDYVK